MSETTTTPVQEQEQAPRKHIISFIYDEETQQVESKVDGHGRTLVEMLLQVMDEDPFKQLMAQAARIKMIMVLDEMKEGLSTDEEESTIENEDEGSKSFFMSPQVGQA